MVALGLLMKELDAVRDADVRERLLGRLSMRLGLQAHEQTAVLLAAAAAESHAARQALGARMELPKWDRRLWDLDQGAALIDGHGREDREVVREVLCRNRSRLTMLLRKRARTPRQLHRLRLRIKDIRYFAEDFGVLVGEPAGSWLMQVRTLQKWLGELRDERGLRAWLRRQYQGYLVAGAIRTWLRARRRDRKRRIGQLRKSLRRATRGG